MITVPNIADRLFRKVSPTPRTTCEQETVSPAFCAIDCPGRCPLKLHMRDGELACVRARKEAPACHRGLAMRAWANSPDRLMWPLRRVGPRGTDRFERISWDEALDTAARELSRIRDEYGDDAVYLAYSTGQSCTTADPFKRLLNCFGGYLSYYNTYSNPQINAMVRHMYGPGCLFPGGSELDAASDAELVVVFGSSPAETGTARATTHGAWDRVVARVGERGGRIIMIDPRRNGSMPPRARSASSTAYRSSASTATNPANPTKVASKAEAATGADAADTATPAEVVSWLPINPGTDGALAAALLHELAFAHNALDWNFLSEHCIGFTESTLPRHRRGQRLSVIDYLNGSGYDRIRKTPAWAARITGVDKNAIEALARQLAHARPAFIMQGWGPQRRSNGEMTSGMIMLLAISLGQVGLPGTNNGMNVAWGGGFLTRIPAGENPVSPRIPSYRFLDAVENGPALGTQEGVQGLASADSASAHASVEHAPAERTLAERVLTERTPITAEPEDGKAAGSEPHLANSIKAIVCHGGNCLTNQHGDVNRAHRVLGDPSKCEFILNIDVEFTDSARYADIVLPDLFRMEQIGMMDADIKGRRIVTCDGALGARFARRGAWDICQDLAQRWGCEDEFTEGKSETEWVRDLYESDRMRDLSLPPFEQAVEQGICFREGVEPRPFTALADWRGNPIAHPLDTPSGKIEIFSEDLARIARSLHGTPDEGSVTPVPTYVPEWGPEEYAIEASRPTRDGAEGRTTAGRNRQNEPLHVFGFHSIARIHSSWGNVPAVSGRVAQVVSINPADARARHIKAGDIVEASNRFGTLRLPAEVTDDVIAGTIVMPQGAWWKAAGAEADAGSLQATGSDACDADGGGGEAGGGREARGASALAAAPVDIGGCINTLTSSRPSPLAFGNPQHTCWCHLRKL